MERSYKDKMNKINSLLGFTNKQDLIEKISLDLISPNPYQPRVEFDNQQLEDLASSIKQYGLLQPIILKKISSREYIIIAGERRFRAATIAGLIEIPAVIKDFNEQEMAEIAIIENLQREDLNYFEEAEAFKKLIDQFNLTQEEVANKVGRSQSMVANKLRLLRLSPKVRKEISTQLLSERHLRALLRLKNQDDQLDVLNKIYKNNLNVKQTDQLVEGYYKNEDNNGKVFSVKLREARDYKLFQNTLKKALKDIEFAGVRTEYKDIEHDDHLEVKIKLYK